jgi:large subunit ribosomal protein L4e
MCRGGHMFAPLKVWRKWNRKVNQNQKRHATAAAVAATAVGPLVIARGHRVEGINEIPLVVDSLSIDKTSTLLKTLSDLGCAEELRRCADSKKIRTGRGKLRNRRYVMRKGPLIVYDDADKKVVKAARNITGVDVANVHRLNLLNLAPGGTLGRFVIWTSNAFKALNDVFGTYRREAAEKKGYNLQRNVMATADVSRLINSDAIQNIIRAPKGNNQVHTRKINPLNNKGVMHKLNPFHAIKAKAEQKASAAAHAKRDAKKKAHRTSKDSKARRANSKNVNSEFWDIQGKSQAAATEKWYADIKAQEIVASSSEEESDS